MNAISDSPQPLDKLLDAESFREVCRSFSELFGIGIRIFDAQGKKLVDIRASTSDHCGYLFTVHPTKVLCTNLVNTIRTCDPGVDPTAPQQHDCFSGLRYKIIPIVYQRVIMGRVIFGPYAPEALKKPPESLKLYEENGLDLKRLGDFQSGIPRASESAVVRVLENMRNVLDVIIHSSYKTQLTNHMHLSSIGGAFADLERANTDLKGANARLIDLDRLKSNFIATVSHELRTPLTSVIGYSEMLLEGMAGSLNDEQSNYVKTILEKGVNLLGLIGQVLDLARIESGNVTITRTSVDPDEIIKFAVSDVTPQAKKRKLKLEVHIEDGIKPITVDPHKVRRILTNLLGNAVKFTPEEGHISLRAKVVEAPPVGADAYDVFEPERNEYLRIEVEDNGVGIPDDQLERVFDSFFQVDNTSTREFGGTGLGLSIVRNFVQAHGGQVSVVSKVGEGSTFTIMLPYHTDSVTGPTRVDGLGG